jgi:hypothetical protein
MFLSETLQRQYGRTAARLLPYDAEVAQKGTYSLPEDGIILLKYVGAIVKEKLRTVSFSAFSWLIST